ncbi:hypothetical protein SISSUDRAFT_1066046 [Sistotremastrum suecicum HHB10207 ss-3]|uniref:Uncharacterized protein n=1 Tax=Sistotremastrum suecicum HHB10207 ss-3 TaxID=1314776 RepID=A0A165YSM1_9AGAM|nr:hypothetical protein SISSUDRAFT_1066046 [Sistotremastrum suecicum HHB10207 ss-3]
MFGTYTIKSRGEQAQNLSPKIQYGQAVVVQNRPWVRFECLVAGNHGQYQVIEGDWEAGAHQPLPVLRVFAVIPPANPLGGQVIYLESPQHRIFWNQPKYLIQLQSHPALPNLRFSYDGNSGRSTEFEAFALDQQCQYARQISVDGGPSITFGSTSLREIGQQAEDDCPTIHWGPDEDQMMVLGFSCWLVNQWGELVLLGDNVPPGGNLNLVQLWREATPDEDDDEDGYVLLQDLRVRWMYPNYKIKLHQDLPPGNGFYFKYGEFVFTEFQLVSQRQWSRRTTQAVAIAN